MKVSEAKTYIEKHESNGSKCKLIDQKQMKEDVLVLITQHKTLVKDFGNDTDKWHVTRRLTVFVGDKPHVGTILSSEFRDVKKKL